MEIFKIYISTLALCIIAMYEIVIRKCNKRERNFLIILILPFVSFVIFDLVQFNYIKWTLFGIFFVIFYLYSFITILKEEPIPKAVRYIIIICGIIMLICILYIAAYFLLFKS